MSVTVIGVLTDARVMLTWGAPTCNGRVAAASAVLIAPSNVITYPRKRLTRMLAALTIYRRRIKCTIGRKARDEPIHDIELPSGLSNNKPSNLYVYNAIYILYNTIISVLHAHGNGVRIMFVSSIVCLLLFFLSFFFLFLHLSDHFFRETDSPLCLSLVDKNTIN